MGHRGEGKGRGGDDRQRPIAKVSMESVPVSKLPLTPTDRSTGFAIRASVEWAIVVACIIALIGNGTLLRSSIIALALLGAIAFTGAIFDHGWYKSAATQKVARKKTAGIVLAIWLCMASLAYIVWPKNQIPSPSKPGIVMKDESDGNNVSGNQFPSNGQISLDDSKGNDVTGNVWVPYSQPPQEPNKFDAMTNAQLENAVSKLAKNLMAFDNRITREQDDFDEPNPDRVAAWKKADDAQRKQMRYDRMKKQRDLDVEDNRYFQDNFLNDCRSANTVLDKRVIAKPSSSVRFAMVGVTLRSGMLGGPYPVRNLADYLGGRAKQLRAQSKRR